VSNFIYEWIILIDERQPNSKISVADWFRRSQVKHYNRRFGKKKDLSSQSQQQQVV